MDRYFNSYIQVMLFFCLIKPAFSYPTPVDFEGKIQRWNINIDSDPITYEIIGNDYLRDNFGPIIDLACQMWSEVPTSYLELAKATSAQKVQITIKLVDGSGNGSSSGYAIFDGDDKNGLSHCTIELTADSEISYEVFSKSALHEVGHCIGLGHSLIPEAIMSYETDKNAFQLDTDDIAAVSRLYPIDGSEPKLPPGCSIYSNSTNSNHKLWLVVLLGLPLILSQCLVCIKNR